jgi:hypothetical protein
MVKGMTVASEIAAPADQVRAFQKSENLMSIVKKTATVVLDLDAVVRVVRRPDIHRTWTRTYQTSKASHGRLPDGMLSATPPNGRLWWTATRTASRGGYPLELTAGQGGHPLEPTAG